MPAYPKPAFIEDEGIYERTAFGAFLMEFHKNSMALDEDAEEKLISLVQDVCENSYQNGQLVRKWLLEKQGLFVEPGVTQPSL